MALTSFQRQPGYPVAAGYALQVKPLSSHIRAHESDIERLARELTELKAEVERQKEAVERRFTQVGERVGQVERNLQEASEQLSQRAGEIEPHSTPPDALPSVGSLLRARGIAPPLRASVPSPKGTHIGPFRNWSVLPPSGFRSAQQCPLREEVALLGEQGPTAVCSRRSRQPVATRSGSSDLRRCPGHRGCQLRWTRCGVPGRHQDHRGCL